MRKRNGGNRTKAGGGAPRASNSAPKAWKDLLGELLSKYDIHPADETGSLMTDWREIIGESQADEIKPAGLTKEGELTVLVPNPTRASQVRWKSAEILEKIQRVMKSEKVKSIVVRVSPRDFEKP